MKEILKTVWALLFIPRAIINYNIIHNIMQYFAYICGRIMKECNG